MYNYYMYVCISVPSSKMAALRCYDLRSLKSEDMTKQRTGIVVTRSEPTSGRRKSSEAKWWYSSFYLPRSKPSFLKFRGLSNERNAFTYIFKYGNVNKKLSDKLCRTIPLQIAEFEGLVRRHIGA